MTLRRDLAFPLRRDFAGRYADTDEHVKDLIAQVLFTLPGERVNLPEFGAGVQRLVFAPLTTEAAHRTQLIVQAQLQRWLGERLQLEGVAVTEDDTRLAIEVSYVRVGAEESHRARFTL